jgi:uncharacterized protein (DUF885 family)
MDWLFLHEAVPGHHFQNKFSIKQANCPTINELTQSTVFIEGWAAYVETLGEQLGLFTDHSSVGYALDWQALRAVRVLLDIGIHHDGWTDNKAREIWQQYIPEQRDIMEREIARIHRWPVQVITYVYGKVMIIKAIQTLSYGDKRNSLATIHREILSLSNLSLNALTFWFNALPSQAASHLTRNNEK